MRIAAIALLCAALFAGCSTPPSPTTTPAANTPVPPAAALPTAVPTTVPSTAIAPTTAPPTTIPLTVAPPTPAPPTVTPQSVPTKPSAPPIAPPPTTAAPPAGPTPAMVATAASPPAPAAAATSARRFVVQAQGSKATLSIKEQFGNLPLPNDAVFTTPSVTGGITIAADGSIGPDSRFTIDFATIKSDDSDRDDHIKEKFLETATFPTGVFVPKEFRGIAKPPPGNGPVKGQLAGDLTIHGVTKPAVFEVDGVLEGATFKGKAKTEVKITDFGMKVPVMAFLLSVEDKVRTEIDLVATAAS